MMSIKKQKNIQLENFLMKRRVAKKQSFTHTSIWPRKGSFYIEDKDLETLYTLYHKEVFEDKKQISLTESNRLLTPVKVDLDFKYHDDKLTRKYTQDDIKEIISYYIQIFSEWYELSEDEKLCFVMEKKKHHIVREKIKKKD